MKTLAITAFFVLLTSTHLAVAASKPEVVATDVCSVLKAPETYVNQVIRLRGFVYLGEDHMNVSSMACPGQGIELVIKSDSVPKQKDVHQFYVRMNRQGRKGVATIIGLFQANKDPLTPYVLNIQHVKNVVPAPNHWR